MTDRGLWLFPVLAIAPLVVLFLTRRSTQTGGLGLADARALAAPARRTTAVAGLTALIAALFVGFAAAQVREPADSVSALLPSGESTVVVLDVSASVSDRVYDEIARTLALLADTPDDSVRVGLVIFSDVAQVALPPGTMPRELRPFLRYFLPKTESAARDRPSLAYASGQFAPAVTNYILSPWFTGFGGGTKISAGLSAAREVIQDHAGRGRVLLISDLDNRDSDAPALARELVMYARNEVPLEVVAVPPGIPAQREIFERIIARESVIDSGSLRREQGSLDPRGPGAPIAFILLTVGLAMVLAAREPFATPADLGRTQRS